MDEVTDVLQTKRCDDDEDHNNNNKWTKSVFNAAGYLAEERRRWQVIYCFPTRTIILKINSQFGRCSNSRPSALHSFKMAKGSTMEAVVIL